MSQKELTKLVGYSGNLLLDGEFNPPPPPPSRSNNASVLTLAFFHLEIIQIGGTPHLPVYFGWFYINWVTIYFFVK